MRAITADYKGSRSISTLTRLARSKDVYDRLLALLLMREESWRQRATHFDLARLMIGDRANDCRWQAVIVIADFLESRTEDVWAVIDQYAERADGDMRTALFCVLLEELWVLDRLDFRKHIRKLAKKHAWMAEYLDDDAFWFIRGTLPKTTKGLLKELQKN